MKLTFVYLVSIFLSVAIHFFETFEPTSVIFFFAIVLFLTSIILVHLTHFKSIIVLNLTLIGLFFFSRQAIDFWWNYEVVLDDGTLSDPYSIMLAKYTGMLVFSVGSTAFIILLKTISKKIFEPIALRIFQKISICGTLILQLGFPVTFYLSTIGYENNYALSMSMVSLLIIFCIGLYSFIKSKAKGLQANLGVLISSSMIIVFVITRFNQ